MHVTNPLPWARRYGVPSFAKPALNIRGAILGGWGRRPADRRAECRVLLYNRLVRKKFAKPPRDEKVLKGPANRVWDEILAKEFPPAKDGRPFRDSSWRWLRHNGMFMKDFIAKDFPWDPASGIPKGIWEMQREGQWQAYKAWCAAQGNWLPEILYSMEPQWTGMFKRERQRRPRGSPLFEDLPPDQQATARAIFDRLSDHPPPVRRDWRRPIRAGVARRLARNPQNCTSEWGKRMRRTKGGIHTQRHFRAKGWHPLASVRKAWGLPEERPPLYGSPLNPCSDETSKNR